MTQTKVLAIDFPFPCSWGANMCFVPIADSLWVDNPERSPTGLASRHSRGSVFGRLKLSTSIFLRSLRSRLVTALLRSYGRSDSCRPGSSALRCMNTVSCDRQVSLIHVTGLPISPPPTTGQASMSRVNAVCRSSSSPLTQGQASPLNRRLAALFQPYRVRYPADGSFTFSCSSPRLAATQLLSVTARTFQAREDLHLPIQCAFRRTIPAYDAPE